MENKKLCKDCKEREAKGFCKKFAGFVPRKNTKEGVNHAETCEFYHKK